MTFCGYNAFFFSNTYLKLPIVIVINDDFISFGCMSRTSIPVSFDSCNFLGGEGL